MQLYDTNADITEKELIESRSNKYWAIINQIKSVIVIAMNLEYIGDLQETVNIHCIKERGSATLELLHLVKSLVYSQNFLKTIFQLVVNYV